MFSQPTGNEIHHQASAVAGYRFNGFSPSDFHRDSDAAISLLKELARQQQAGDPLPQEARTCQRSWESSPPLQKLPPSEWRSLGGYFDYCDWADRDRFMELDRAIAASQRSQMYELETDAEMYLISSTG